MRTFIRTKLQVVTVATLAVATAPGCSQSKQAAKEAPAVEQTVVPVKVQTVKAGPYQEYGEYYGTVMGFEEAGLVSYGGGRVAAIEVMPGDAVKKGQRLCDIDGERYEIAFESAKLAERIAKQNADRSQLHLKRGSTSRLNADRSRLEYLQAKNRRVEAEKMFNGAYCITPIDGIVVAKHIERFDDLAPGQPSVTIARMDKVKVVVGLPESVIDGYQAGSPAEVFLNSHPGMSWKGKIYTVSQSVNQEDRTFKVHVEVDNPEGFLKPGLTARVRLLRYELSDRVVIPSEVILTKANGRVVMVAEEGVARTRKITVQSANETQSLIVSGLNVGDQLIVKGQAIAVDGTPLELVE